MDLARRKEYCSNAFDSVLKYLCTRGLAPIRCFDRALKYAYIFIEFPISKETINHHSKRNQCMYSMKLQSQRETCKPIQVQGTLIPDNAIYVFSSGLNT